MLSPRHSLNSEGSKQLNFNVLKQNVKDDILLPLATGVRQTEVLKLHHMCVKPKITVLKQCCKARSIKWCLANVLSTPIHSKLTCMGNQAAFNQQDLNNIDNLLAL